MAYTENILSRYKKARFEQTEALHSYTKAFIENALKMTEDIPKDNFEKVFHSKPFSKLIYSNGKYTIVDGNDSSYLYEYENKCIITSTELPKFLKKEYQWVIHVDTSYFEIDFDSSTITLKFTASQKYIDRDFQINGELLPNRVSLKKNLKRFITDIARTTTYPTEVLENFEVFLEKNFYRYVLSSPESIIETSEFKYGKPIRITFLLEDFGF